MYSSWAYGSLLNNLAGLCLVFAVITLISYKSSVDTMGEKLTKVFIFSCFILSAVLDIGGKSLGLYFTLFILGFMLFKYKGFEEILLKNRKRYLFLPF